MSLFAVDNHRPNPADLLRAFITELHRDMLQFQKEFNLTVLNHPGEKTKRLGMYQGADFLQQLDIMLKESAHKAQLLAERQPIRHNLSRSEGVYFNVNRPDDEVSYSDILAYYHALVDVIKVTRRVTCEGLSAIGLVLSEMIIPVNVSVEIVSLNKWTHQLLLVTYKDESHMLQFFYDPWGDLYRRFEQPTIISFEMLGEYIKQLKQDTDSEGETDERLSYVGITKAPGTADDDFSYFSLVSVSIRLLIAIENTPPSMGAR